MRGVFGRLWVLASTGAVAALPVVGPRHGDWFAQVEQVTGGPRTCRVRNTANDALVYDPVGTLTIRFADRGGVAGFRWRVDHGPQPGSARLPRAGVNDNVVISDVQNELSQGGWLLVTGVTRARRSFDLQVNLNGLAQAKADAFRMCGIG